MLKTVVVHLHEIPVGVIGIKNGNNKTTFHFSGQQCFESQIGEPLVNRIVNARMSSPFSRFTFGKIFLQSLNRGVDRLHGRREMHLSRFLKIVILQEEIAIVRTLGIVCRRLN